MTYVFPTYTPPPPYPVIATLAPCRDCGEPIQPGQSYVPGKRGPLHRLLRPGPLPTDDERTTTMRLDPSLLLFLPAHRHALACGALRGQPGTAALLRALIARSAQYSQQNAQCAALMWLEYRAYLLIPPSIVVRP